MAQSDDTAKDLSRTESAKRLLEQCTAESQELAGILRTSSRHYDDLSRRVDLAEANIKTLESRYVLLDNFTKNVEKVVEDTVKDALVTIQDDIKAIRMEQSSLIKIRERLTNAVFLLAGVGLVSIIFAIANTSIQTFSKIAVTAGSKAMGGP